MKKEFKKFLNEKVDNAFIGVDEAIVKRYNAIVNFTEGKKINVCEAKKFFNINVIVNLLLIVN